MKVVSSGPSVLPGQPDGLSRANGRDYCVPHIFQHARDEAQDGRLILHYQDGLAV